MELCTREIMGDSPTKGRRDATGWTPLTQRLHDFARRPSPVMLARRTRPPEPPAAREYVSFPLIPRGIHFLAQHAHHVPDKLPDGGGAVVHPAGNQPRRQLLGDPDTQIILQGHGHGRSISGESDS